MALAPLRFFRSLRFQLSFWNTLGAVAILLAVSLGFYLGVGFLLTRELDQVLDEDCRELILMVDQGASPEAVMAALVRKVESHSEQSWYGRVLLGESVLEAGPIPDSVKERGWTGPDGRAHLGSTCVVQRAARDMKVQAGSSTDFLADDLGRVRVVLAVVGLAMLVISPGLGYWLAGRATDPLGSMLAMARTLGPQSLEGRLPHRGVDDELDMLAQTINGLLDKIQQYTLRQRDFVANAAHELRSPLAAIKASVELDLDKPPAADGGRDTLLDILEEVESLITLVNRLLLLAESDAGGLVARGHSTDLADLARRVADMFRGVAEQRGIELRAEVLAEGRVKGERGMLKQVLCNLVDNALKNTPEGGVVTLRVSSDSKTQPCWFSLEVVDTGPGFPADILPRLFERFSLSGTMVRSSRGTGLGLSICKAIVEGSGGAIRAENMPTKGARVLVKVPVASVS